MPDSTDRHAPEWRARAICLLAASLLVAGCIPHRPDKARIGAPSPTAWPAAIAAPSPGALPPSLPTAVLAPSPAGWTAYPAINNIQGLAFSPDGALWAATTAGVVRWDLTAETYIVYTAVDGLASDLAMGIAVAPDGSPWVATLGGVSHLDGGRWTSYTQAGGLPGSSVQAIAVTAAGVVWAGTTEGAGRFDGRSWTTHLPGARVWDLDVASDGSVWFAADGAGVSRYSPAGDAWTTYTAEQGLPSLNVTALAAGPAGDAWVYVLWEGVYHLDGAAWQRALPHTALVCAIALEAGGAPWIGTCGSLHYSSGSLTHRQGSQGDGWVEVADWHELGAPAVRAIAFGPGGEIAVATDRGLSIRRGGEWRTLRQGPTLDQVTVAAVTPDGAAWFGGGDSASDAAGGGLSRFGGQTWQYFLDDANVQALAVGPDGALWAGAGCTLWRLDGRDRQQVGGCDELQGNALDIAVAPDGAVWVATGMGLARFDGQSWTTYNRFVHSVAIAPAPPGGTGTVLWAAGWEGTQNSGYVAYFDGSTWTKTLDRSLGSLVVTPDGLVWGLTGDQGLARFDGRSWTFHPAGDLPPGSAGALAVAPDGALWAGGEDSLARFDGDGWTVYPSAGGVRAIAFAPDGALWLGTAHGAAHFQPSP